MTIPRSIWVKSDETENEFPTFCLFLPDDGIVLNITPSETPRHPYLVWRVQYIEEGNGSVRTFMTATHENGYEESYSFQDDRLIWTTASGKIIEYTRADEGDVPKVALPEITRRRDLLIEEFSPR